MMESASDQRDVSGPTVLIVSQRERLDGFGKQPGFVAFMESEDVLASTCDADMFMSNRHPKHPLVRARRLTGRHLRRLSHSTRPMPMVLPKRHDADLLREHYDVAIFVGFTVWDLPLLERLSSVRKRADRIIAWFPEAWVSEFDDDRVRYEALGLLDSMYVGMETAFHELAGLAPCPVRLLPPAVDVTRFASLQLDDHRPVDVLGIGRRDARLHRALLDWSQKSNKFYLYDTVTGTTVPDADAHRQNLGDTYRQTDIALTHYAKFDLPGVTRGDRELPGRLWEGLASGSIMLGASPDQQRQKDLVGDIVVTDMPANPHEAVELIEEIQRRDNSRERRANTQLALRHHDWAHRWNDLFTQSGLPSPTGLQARIERLDAMADSLDLRRT